METIVIAGGGFAGLNVLHAVNQENKRRKKTIWNVVLVDPQPAHFRKVQLFQAIVHGEAERLRVPFERYVQAPHRFVQGSVDAIDANDRSVFVTRADGSTERIRCDKLVLGLGSVVRAPDPSQGGIPLSGADNALAIRGQILQALDRQPAAPVHVAIAGAGISGIETAAELAAWLAAECRRRGLPASNARVCLLNAGGRLLPDLPEPVTAKLERRLRGLGVEVRHQTRAARHADGRLALEDGSETACDALIWTLGLRAAPQAQRLGLPVDAEGRIPVNERYAVQGLAGVYAIGDAAAIRDPRTGAQDGMTCKEAIAQANRLVRIWAAEQAGKRAPHHEAYPDMYCIGLGPEQGFVWARKWGIDFTIGGKLAQRVRTYTWDMASLLHEGG